MTQIKTEGLKKRREQLKMSLTELAMESCVPVDAVRRWENGTMTPEDNFGDLFKMCDVLGIKFPTVVKRAA